MLRQWLRLDGALGPLPYPSPLAPPKPKPKSDTVHVLPSRHRHMATGLLPCPSILNSARLRTQSNIQPPVVWSVVRTFWY